MSSGIDRLVDAYRTAGLPPLREPEDGSQIGELKTAIAPLILPPEVEECWRRITPGYRTMTPHPMLSSPRAALETWQRHRDTSPVMTPPVLFPVCYEGHCFMFVELDDGGGSPGTCFEWSYGGGPFDVVFPSFAAYVELWATMIELGEFTVERINGRNHYLFDTEDRWVDAQVVRLRAALPLPRYGDQTRIDEDPSHWPSHWLRSNGLVPWARAPKAALSTLAELVDRVRSGRDAAGIVHAWVTGLAGSSEGRQAVIDDGTARVDVWCPANVCRFGPTMHEEFEFEIVVHSGSWVDRRTEDPSGSIRDLMRGGESDSASLAGAEIVRRLFDVPHGAEATAVRPLR